MAHPTTPRNWRLRTNTHLTTVREIGPSTYDDSNVKKKIDELEQQVAELHEAIARIVAASNDQLKAIIAVDKRIEGMTLERIRVA